MREIDAKTLTPASIIFSMTSSLEEAGPSVATILVFFIFGISQKLNLDSVLFFGLLWRKSTVLPPSFVCNQDDSFQARLEVP